MPVASIPDQEPCGVDIDNPCAFAGFQATALPLDTVAQGTAWSDDTARDVDWFQVTLPAAASLKIECWSAGPLGISIVDDQCPPTVFADSPDGCPAIAIACLPAGTFRVVVKPLLFETLSCGDPRSEYAIRATALPCVPMRPANDRCDTATVASEGLIAFDTSEATSDPAWLASWCDEGAGLTFTNDVWFIFYAPATAVYRFSTCDVSNFDTRLAVYAQCGGDVLACNDDACPDGGSAVELGLTCGSSTLIRVGGWGHGAASRMRIESVDTGSCGCAEDLDGDGVVGLGDIAFALLSFGDLGGPADIDFDGEVTNSDIALMLLSTGPCP